MAYRTDKHNPAETLTICFFDAPLCTIAKASKQARSLGIQGWILESDSLPQGEDTIISLPLCGRWQGPFDSPAIAQRIISAMEPFIEAGQWLHHREKPIVVLSNPDWQPPVAWLGQFQQMMTERLGVCPILLCDFALADDQKGENIIGVAQPGHGAFKDHDTNILNFQGCIYTANYSNPLTCGLLIPLVPPPALHTTGKTSIPSPEMRNHTPTEYQKLWIQTAALARLLAKVNSLLGIRIVTSWEGHHAASRLDLKPSPHRPDLHQSQRPILSFGHQEITVSHSTEHSKKQFALAIHGYHLDSLHEILKSNQHTSLKERATLFISLQRGLSSSVSQYLEQHGWDFELVELSNHGRDVLPFVLAQLPRIHYLGYRYFGKIHTKKSVHLRSGRNWGDWLGNEIINAIASGMAGDLLANDQSIGLLAPDGAIAPITLHIGNNIDWLEALISRSKMSIESFLMASFVAGTMMIGRVDTMVPLLGLELTRDHFELEAGQLDGTLAHALERMIGAICMNGGFRLESFQPNVYFNAGLGYKT